jgi:hypothetical protein
VLLGIAGACALLVLIFVVVATIVVGAGHALDLCDAQGTGRGSTKVVGNVEWHWIPPHPECVWRTDEAGHRVGPPRAGAPQAREAVVFDALIGSVALVLLAFALGFFGWWLVLSVREAERIADDGS